MIKIIAIILLLGLLGVGGGYLFMQRSGSVAVPSSTPVTGRTEVPQVSTTPGAMTLTLSSPASGVTVSTASVVLQGRTTAGAEVFVNEAQTVANSSGQFSLTVSLEEGANYLVITAIDATGQVAEQELTINYE